MSVKKEYSEPKLNDFGGNLDKRWYVYFSFRNPATGKLERHTPVYTGLHQYKSLRERREAGKVLCETLSEIFADGLYNPFRDNSTLQLDIEEKLTVEQACKFVLDYKANIYAGGLIDFRSRLSLFKGWLHRNGFRDRYIAAVTKPVVKKYLNYVLEKNSAANSNNARSALHNFFETLVENDYLLSNPVERIKPIKNVRPTRNKSFTAKEVDAIFSHLEEHDPMLGLFIKFVSYNFLRPIEVSRLLVSSVDTGARRLLVKTKDGRFTTKRIPDVLLAEIPDLSGLHPDNPLFGKTVFGQAWDSIAETRRGDYSERFRLAVKVPFGFGTDYSIYSFRHTFVARLFTALLAEHSPDEAEGITMHITGHATRQALRKYLRDIDASLPDDYSRYIGTVI